MREHGQFVSFDLATAVLVFVFMLFFLFQAWSSNSDAWEHLRQRTELEERTKSVAKILVESPGFPSNWNSSDVNIPGLAIRPGVLDPAKTAAFSSMDYNSVRNKLNILAFGFSATLRAENGPNPLIDRNFGIAFSQTSNGASVERRVLIGDAYAVFRLQLFR